MTTATETAPPAKQPKVNRLNLEKSAYKGLASTLCKGCGHDSITRSIIDSLFDYGVDPMKVAKLSGIGCSSKTSAYFLSQSHGFNSVHGRMAPIATGVSLANRELLSIGVSGDGDTASIGLGNFLHMVRRNVPMVYIIENNGCYGLTKGQFSATADRGSVLRKGQTNELHVIDCCALAIELGCGYVARSYSGDFKQLQAILKGAIAHSGTSVIDVISPCITFNDHEGSTKSFKYTKEHKGFLHEVAFRPFFETQEVDYEPGETRVIEMADGSKITLGKINGADYDPTDRFEALKLLDRGIDEKFYYTGLIYHEQGIRPLDEQLEMTPEPLATLPVERLRPSDECFNKIMDMFR